MDYLPTGNALINPFTALETAGIRDEMNVADFGVGTVGHFLFPAARLVGPKGHVYGIEVQKTVIEANQSRSKFTGADNVELIWGDFERAGGTRLPDSSMDMVMMINVLHAIDKAGGLKEASRVLATGGILLVIEWKLAGTSLGPPSAKRLSKDDAKAAAQEAGFDLVKDFEAGPSHYGLVLKKKSG